MNGAKHRFSLILTCLLLTGLTVVYPFLLYTDNAFVTKWREWYIETAMGTMTHQWLATSFIPHDMIEKVMTKRYLMNQKQAGAESFWDFTLDTDGEEQAISPKARFYKLYSELDETEFESFLDKNPDIKEQGYEAFEFDFIGDATRKGYDTGLKTRQGDPVLALDVKHGILIVEQTGEDALGLEYAGKLALCKKPENVYVGTCEGLGDYGSYVSEIADRYSATLGINASGFADYEGNGTGGLPYGFLKSEGTELQGAVGNGWKIIGFDESNHLQVGEFSDTERAARRGRVPSGAHHQRPEPCGRYGSERSAAAHRHRSGQGRHGTHARHRRPSVPLVRRFDRALRRDHGRVRRVSGVHAGRRLVLGHGL